MNKNPNNQEILVRERLRVSSDDQGFAIRANLFRQGEPPIWKMETLYKGVSSVHRFIRQTDAIEAWNRFFYEHGHDIVFDDWRRRSGRQGKELPPSPLITLLQVFNRRNA